MSRISGVGRHWHRWVALPAAGLLAVVLGPALPQARGAEQQPAPLAAVPVPAAAMRIAYAGTQHHSLGVVTNPQPGQPNQTEELFGPGPAHFDEQAAARGDLLAFVSQRDEAHPQVYLRTPEPTNPTGPGLVQRLTSGLDAAHPEISPDRQRVAFDSPGPTGTGGTQRDLWVVQVDGTGLQRLTDTPRADETFPTWSPDGSEIAFSSDQDPARGREIYRMPSAGGAILPVSDEPTGAAIEPVWNPVDDAAHRELIAFTCDGDGDLSGTDDQKLHIIRVVAGPTGPGVADTPLFAGNRSTWQSREASWMPDGNALLFISRNVVATTPGQPENPDSVDKVYRVDTIAGLPTTADPQLLLAEDRAASFPTFLEDCSCGRLVVSRTGAPDRSTVTLQDIRQDGSDPRDLGVTVLREDPGAEDDPSL